VGITEAENKAPNERTASLAIFPSSPAKNPITVSLIFGSMSIFSIPYVFILVL